MRSRRGAGKPSEAAEAFGQEALRVQVYRFRDSVAVSIGGEVVYLSRRQAADIGRAIKACSVDIAKNPDFFDTKFGTFTLGEK